MSWRLIFAFLLIAAGASAWGGLRLGDWLIANGPTKIFTPPHFPDLDNDGVLNADGKPYTATAPQVLSDGRQGVPTAAPPVDWSVSTVSLMDSFSPIALATTTISLDEAIELASQNDPANELGAIEQYPIEIDDAINQIAQASQGAANQQSSQTAQNWQTKFQAELKACEKLGFFARPSCAWTARNKYCEPNNAWGKVPGCPSKNSNF